MAEAKFIYVNGEFLSLNEPHLSALDRGLTLGDGVFETMRCRGDCIFRLEAHLSRLRKSSAAIHLPLPHSEAQFSRIIKATLTRNDLQDAVVRLTISRGVPSHRGLAIPELTKASIVVHAMPFTLLPASFYQKGISAIFATIRRNEHSPLAYVKSCNYLDNVLAREEASQKGADDAIMLNTAGYVACATSSNLFLIKAGTLVTPSLDCGVLAGVTRSVVFETAEELAIKIQERPIAKFELDDVEEAFVTNTVLGIMPLTHIDGKPVSDGNPGPITRQLAEHYEHLLAREIG